MGNILEKLSATKPEKTQEDQKDEAQTIFFDCQSCQLPISPSMKFTNNNHCHHVFCTDCVANYINSKLEANAIEITCPGADCETVLDPMSCLGIVDDLSFQRWLDLLCYSVIAGLKNCYCPYSNCRALIVDECNGRDIFATRSKCPQCRRWFCFWCRTPWHDGRRCDLTSRREMMSLNDLLFMEMTAGKEKKLSSCPKCHMYTELVPALGFCIVRCRCKTVFCFHCGRERTRLSCDCKEFEEEIHQYNASTVMKWVFLAALFGVGLCIWAARVSDSADTFF